MVTQIDDNKASRQRPMPVTRVGNGKAPARTTPASKHDSLCPDHPDYPLTSGTCWCECSKCWRNEGHTRLTRGGGGMPKGRCICAACPCHPALAPTLLNFILPARSGPAGPNR